MLPVCNCQCVSPPCLGSYAADYAFLGTSSCRSPGLWTMQHMQQMQAHKSHVLSRYRELLRLVQRLPADKAAAEKAEAQQTIRQRQAETNPDARLQYLKELVAKISFLRITTPRRAGEKLDGGSYVLREGQLVKGSGEDKGARVADGSMDMDKAKRLNREHYKRIYGKPMPKEMFF